MKKLALAITGLLIAAGTLQAATVTYTNSVTMNNDQNTTINLSQFDPSLGTLTAVYVKYVVSISGANVQMDNDSNLAQNGTARVQNLVNSFSSTASLLDPSFQMAVTGIDLQLNINQLFALAATSGDTVGQFNNTGNSDYASWTPGTVQAFGDGLINSLVFSQYTGLGTYGVSVNSTFSTTATFDGSSGYFQGNSPTGAFSGEVTYTYTPAPIPEPATASMLALVAAIGFLIRRRFIA